MQIRVRFRQPIITSLLVLILAASVILLPLAVMMFLEAMEISVSHG